MMTNKQKIQAWRDGHTGERITAATLRDLIGTADLRTADLRGANLYGADLGGADLRGANLYGADLGGANLGGANLYGANLYGANLGGANLGGANLYGGVLQVQGLPSGTVTFVPTVDGWVLRVGCWKGDPDDLEALIATDEGWPEARGAECDERRPGLAAVVALARAHIAANEDALREVRERWGSKGSA